MVGRFDLLGVVSGHAANSCISGFGQTPGAVSCRHHTYVYWVRYCLCRLYGLARRRVPNKET